MSPCAGGPLVGWRRSGTLEGTEVTESVELATLWLVDLVGSTRLATSVGPVRADELRDEFFALLREAIDASGGREFKNTGDGLFVAFSSASAGVRCAVATQQLFERRYRGAEQRLHVRIGLGTGEVTLKEGDYFGMPPIEATRLCDLAPADGILVSSLTRQLAGRVDGARFEPVGELELKGIPGPVEAFAVQWEPLDPERSGVEMRQWPLPEALRVVPRIAYVGREAERELVERARRSARAGVRQVVLLSGEPGIGKTRLASYAALGANADGFAVCWGGCSEDLAAPYEPWIELCSQIVEHAAEDVLAGYAQMHGGEISRLAGNFARRVTETPAPQSSDPETERFMLYKAVAELLRAVAASVPLCVVLDDFHWADGQSVALLKHVARNVERGALQLLVTYRDTDLTKGHPLTGVLADLRRLEGVQRVALRGLTSEDVRVMTEAAAGHDLDSDGVALAGEIAAETDGNPFFVGEILRNLSESGIVVFDEARGRWEVDRSSGVALPESVREVVERRVDVLGAGVRETLTAAAVIGRSFDLELLSELVELREAELLGQLEAAVQASLLVESAERVGRFTFAHALINHTLYQALGGTRRARMHLRVGEVLEGLAGSDPDAQLAELAWHWRLATVSVNTTKAAGFALRAGRQALDRLAPSEAARLFGDAVDLLGHDDTAERCEALIGLGEAQRLIGEATYRDTLLEASRIASERGDADRAARAALANNRGLVSVFGHTDEVRVAAIDRAIELDEPPRRARRVQLLSLAALERMYELDSTRSRKLAREAIVLARATGDPRVQAEVLVRAWQALISADTVAERAALHPELLASALASGDNALEFWARWLTVYVSIEQGEIDRAREALAQADRIADQLGQPTLKWAATWISVSLPMLSGDLTATEERAERALQLGQEAGQPDAPVLHAGAIIAVRLVQGRVAEVLPRLEQNAAAYPRLITLRAGLAQALAWSGRTDEAAAIVGQITANRLDDVPWDPARTHALARFTEAAVVAGPSDAYPVLHKAFEPFADQIISSGAGASGLSGTYVGMLAAKLGQHERADEHLRIASEYHRRNGMLVWEARSELAWAEALAERGETERGRTHATRALELARGHGYGAYEPRAAAILAAPAQPPSTSSTSSTSRSSL